MELKISRAEEGYVVFIYDVKNYKWSKSDQPGYGNPEEVCYGKVIEFGVSDYELLSKDQLDDQLKVATEKENYVLAAKIRDIIKTK